VTFYSRTESTRDDFITPPIFLERLGPFDVDPAASTVRPWEFAPVNYTIDDDGLSRDWSGAVWLNPPYGRSTATWVRRLALHGNGIALIFARTDTRMFFEWVWPRARSILFLRGRVAFYSPAGTIIERAGGGRGIAGSPSVLIGYGEAADRLERVADLGKLLRIGGDR
jgi:hypothetical protein